MLAELVDVLVWLVRAVLIAGLAWGAWLSFGPASRPQKSTPRSFAFERFATFALLVLLLTTIGSLLHAG
jgi:hypothetical protein